MKGKQITDPRPLLDTPCPRCGDLAMREPVESNALSRTTREEEDIPVYVCSPCGVDEGLEGKQLTDQSEWPRAHRYMISKMWATAREDEG